MNQLPMGAIEADLDDLLGPAMTDDEIRQERITRRVWAVGAAQAEQEIREAYFADRIDDVEFEAAVGCLPLDDHEAMSGSVVYDDDF